VQIIAIDDDPLMLHTIAMVLEDDHGDILQAEHPSQAQSYFESYNIQVVVLDLNFAIGDSDGAEGLAWIKRLHEQYPHLSIIVLTAHGFIEVAVKALKQGASDFLEKPFTNEKLIATVQAGLNLAQTKQALKDESLKNEALLSNSAGDHFILGRSPSMQKVQEIIDKVAPTDASILITGDHGTGKEVWSQYIHRRSLRASEAYVSVDLNALTQSLFESNLFGHVQGAFTDAHKDKIGLIEAANMGTLCLDEIGSLPLSLQAKLLKVLQNREVQRIGDHQNRAVDLRLISTTHHSLDALKNEQLFRQDLLYRINTVHIHLPPLRDRLEDIIPLAELFIRTFNRKYDKTVEISKSLKKDLKDYHWPGNVRELKNSIERMVVMDQESMLSTTSSSAPVDNLYLLEKTKIEEVMSRHAGNITHAAAELGIGRNTLYRKLKKYDL